MKRTALTPSIREVFLDARGSFRLAVLCAALIVVSVASARASVPSQGPAPPRAPGARPSAPWPAGLKKPAAGKTLTMLYGDDHCFGLVVPTGWVVDDTSGLGAKIRVVMYPKGQRWATSATVMYVNPLHQEPGHTRTLLQMIDRDVTAFARQSPHGKVTVAPTVHTDAGQTAEVRYFAREGREPEEAVAYVMEKGLVMLLVLASHEPGGFTRALPAYREMVTGYQFVAADIRTPTHSE